jgi:hypothetical protein
VLHPELIFYRSQATNPNGTASPQSYSMSFAVLGQAGDDGVQLVCGVQVVALYGTTCDTLEHTQQARATGLLNLICRQHTSTATFTCTH